MLVDILKWANWLLFVLLVDFVLGFSHVVQPKVKALFIIVIEGAFNGVKLLDILHVLGQNSKHQRGFILLNLLLTHFFKRVAKHVHLSKGSGPALFLIFKLVKRFLISKGACFESYSILFCCLFV